jgi:polysaccharide biosynthesis transport protein
VRTIRTGVILAGIQSSQKVIVVTSSIPGEGKTTLSSNLAMALGQMEKVLYIDADMRRPSVANELGFNRRKIGLAELCAGTAGLDECLEPFEAGGIDVLTSGAVPVNPLELLSSQKFTNLIEGFCQSYDRVVIDSSPIQAVSDAMVLSQMCDALVYVVKSDATPTNVVLNGVQKLVRVNAPIIGVVLNQFDASVVSKYGYYSSYRYGGDYYGYGYAKDTT